jgi:hypothetical protein
MTLPPIARPRGKLAGQGAGRGAHPFLGAW